MDDTQVISRRASVKSLAFVGAAMAAGMAAEVTATPPDQPNRDGTRSAANPAELAIARFQKGHSCSQAVFSAFAERMGVDYRTAAKISAGFGGGMYLGSVCGAVTGAFMAIGLKYGGAPNPNAQMAKLVREFADRFKAKHRSVNCSDLLGLDLSTVDLSKPEEVKALKEKLMKERNPYALCGSFVRDAAEILDALMNEPHPGVPLG